MIRSRKKLNRVGEKRYPCITLAVILNHSPMLPFSTALVALSKSCSVVRTRFALILYFRMVACKAACHTLFEISEDKIQILLMLEVLSHRILRLKICSVVLVLALSPAQ